MSKISLELKLRKVLCDLCKSDNVNLCKTCDIRLCSNCWIKLHPSEPHDRFNILKSIEPLPHQCKAHSRAIVLYCRQCEQTCCMLCRASDMHSSHADQMIELSKWTKEQIVSVRPDLLDITSKLISSNSSSESKSDISDELCQQVHQKFQEIYSILQEREKKLCDDIRNSRQQSFTEGAASDWMNALLQDFEALENESTNEIPCFSTIKFKVQLLKEDVNSSASSTSLVFDANIAKLREAIERHITLVGAHNGELTTTQKESEDTEYVAMGFANEYHSPNCKDRNPNLPPTEINSSRLIPKNFPPSQGGDKVSFKNVYKSDGLTYAKSRNDSARRKHNYNSKSFSRSENSSPLELTKGSLPGNTSDIKESQRFIINSRRKNSTEEIKEDSLPRPVAQLPLRKKEPIEKITPMPQPPPIVQHPLQSNNIVNITYIVNPADFYLIRLSDQDKVNRMSYHFQNAYQREILLPLQKDQITDDILMAFFDSEWKFWFRVLILPHEDSSLSDGNVPCFFVDKGQAAPIDYNYLFTINHRSVFRDETTKEYLNIVQTPPLSYWCQLDGISPLNTKQGWTEDALNNMAKFTIHRNFCVKVTAVSKVNLEICQNTRRFNSQKYSVDLLAEGKKESLRDFLLINNFARLQSQSRNGWDRKRLQPLDNNLQLNSIDYEYADLTSTYAYQKLDKDNFPPLSEVAVTSFLPPEYFWIQLISYDHCIRQLSADLQRIYATNRSKHQFNSTIRLTKGSLVVAQYSEDELWYRAMIEEVHPQDNYVVRFVDYGNSEARNIRCMRRLLENLRHIPVASFCCKLVGVTIPRFDIASIQFLKYREFTSFMETILMARERILASVEEDLYHTIPSESCPVGSGPGNTLLVTLYSKEEHQIINHDVQSYINREFDTVSEPIVDIPLGCARSTNVNSDSQMNLPENLDSYKENLPDDVVSCRSSSPNPENIPLPLSRNNSTASSLSVSVSSCRPLIKKPRARHHMTADDFDMDDSDDTNAIKENIFEHLLDVVDSPSDIEYMPRFRVYAYHSPHNLFIQQINSGLISDLNYQLEKFYGRSDNPNRQSLIGNHWPVGTTCIFYTDELKFRRVKLLEIIPPCATQNDSVWVYLLDFGLSKIALINKLFLLPQELSDIYPAQAIHCCLPGLKPTGGSKKWSLTTYERLKEILDLCNNCVRLKGFLKRSIPVENLSDHNDPYDPDCSSFPPSNSFIFNENRLPCELIAELPTDDGLIYKTIGLYLADKGVAFREKNSLKNLMTNVSQLSLTPVTPSFLISERLNDDSCTDCQPDEVIIMKDVRPEAPHYLNTDTIMDLSNLSSAMPPLSCRDLKAPSLNSLHSECSWSTVDDSRGSSPDKTGKISSDDILYTKDKPGFELDQENSNCHSHHQQPQHDLQVELPGSGAASIGDDSDGVTITARQFQQQASISYVSQSSHGNLETLKWPEFPLPPEDQWDDIPVTVTHVSNQMEIYCITKENDNNRALIDQTLLLVYGENGLRSRFVKDIKIPNLNDWKYGDHCIVKAKIDDMFAWKRGIILIIDESTGIFHVLLIDSGELREVLVSLLRPILNFTDIDMNGPLTHSSQGFPDNSSGHHLPVDPLIVQPCVFKCVLHHVSPINKNDPDDMNCRFWEEEDLLFVRNWAYNQPCRLSIVEPLSRLLDPAPNTLACRLLCPGLRFLELGDELCKRFIAYRYDRLDLDESFIKTLWKFDHFHELPMPPDGFVCPVKLIDLEKPDEYFIHLDIDPEYVNKYKATHEKIDPEIEEFFKSALHVFHFLTEIHGNEFQDEAASSCPFKTFNFLPVENLACVARFSGDQCWYRAEISAMKDNFPLVHYIDFGNKEFVKWTDCREDIPCYRSQPASCRKVRWKNVRRAKSCPLERDTLVEKLQDLLKILIEKTFYMKVLKVYRDGRLPLVEFYQDEDCSRSLLEIFRIEGLLDVL